MENFIFPWIYWYVENLKKNENRNKKDAFVDRD